MSLYATISKPAAALRPARLPAAVFAGFCALHIAVLAFAGSWHFARKAPAPNAPSFLRFEFDAPVNGTPAAQIPAEAVPERPAVTEAATSAAASADAEAAVAGAAGAEGGASGGMSESDYLALIMRRLEENKVYPLAMRKRGIEGAMPVRFTIRADGTLARVQADENGAHPFLVQAALETVKSASPFPAPESAGGDFSVQVTIKYQLE